VYVTNVSWTSNNSKRRSNSNTKRFPMVFYLDIDGNLHTKRISRLAIPFYKAKICKRKTFLCDKCEKKFQLILQKDSIVECPYCLES